jgi:hypothetical protein
MSGVMNMLLGARTAIAAAVDEFFNRVTLLLPGDGTNGAQNNTFLDSSTNNFTITRNGNTTQGTFSPFSQTGWSNYFAGSGNNLTIATTTAFGVGTGDFTLECWVFCAFTGVDQTIIDFRSSLTVTPWAFSVSSTGLARTYDGSSVRSGGQLTANSWNHVAWVRASNVNTVYVNGVSGHTWTATTNFGSTNPATIAASPGGVEAYTGYISNLRFLKGTALYTATFTPPTAPLTNITNTSLLTCQSNRFVDNGTANSGSGFAITTVGSPSVQAFSPFAPTAAYSASTVGGSGYFDGTGDYLTAANNAAFAFGTGDFTIEAWVYASSLATSIIFSNSSGSGAANINFYITSDGKLNANNLNTVQISSTGAITANSWNHVAITKASGTYYFWINGAASGNHASLGTNNLTDNSCWVGARPTPTDFWNGYIFSLRVVKGTAVYTAAFTPPTSPLTNITNTSLLLNYTNAGITDATAKNDLETVGNAQISTTQSKFGGSSMYFDGTGDYLLMPDNPDLELEAGDFTIEAWVYLTALNTERNIISKNASQATCGAYILQVNSSNVIKLYASNNTSSWVVNNVGTATISQNTWTHVAVTRSGSTFTVWVNGTSSGTATSSLILMNQTVRTTVGANENGSLPWLGYIDDLRITKGFARYTTNFTPPTAAFPLQ